MFRIRKRVLDTVWIKQCKRDACKCVESMKDKKTISVRDTNMYRDCFNSNTIQKVLERQNSMTIHKRDDRSYPPLL